MSDLTARMDRNVALFPWHRFCMNLLFWQATWFLYFQSELSAAQAMLLYAVYDITVTALEVPSGYFSDRVGRRITLILSAIAYCASMLLLSIGGVFWVFVAGQMLMGMGSAFNSGTDTSLLVQSLAVRGRVAEMERETLRAWRFAFAALALSAVLGGAAALVADRLPFILTGLAMFTLLIVTLRLTEPPTTAGAQTTELRRLRDLLAELRAPVLGWLFMLGVVMYSFSHVPFVFGQPFISETLAGTVWTNQTPFISGVVIALMMLISLTVSLIAPPLRVRLGLAALLLLAFAIQIGVTAALAVSGTALAILLLVLRMVPDSLSGPFIVANVQMRLGDDTRATFLSLQSLVGKLLFALSLWVAAGATTAVDTMPIDDIQTILWAYAATGIGCFALLAFAVVRISFDPQP